MTSKKYRCIVELTTRPQADGKRLTFYPDDIIEAKFLRNSQAERLLGMGVIENIKKARTRTTTSSADSENVDGS